MENREKIFSEISNFNAIIFFCRNLLKQKDFKIINKERVYLIEFIDKTSITLTQTELNNIKIIIYCITNNKLLLFYRKDNRITNIFDEVEYFNSIQICDFSKDNDDVYIREYCILQNYTDFVEEIEDSLKIIKLLETEKFKIITPTEEELFDKKLKSLKEMKTKTLQTINENFLQNIELDIFK